MTSTCVYTTCFHQQAVFHKLGIIRQLKSLYPKRGRPLNHQFYFSFLSFYPRDEKENSQIYLLFCCFSFAWFLFMSFLGNKISRFYTKACSVLANRATKLEISDRKRKKKHEKIYFGFKGLQVVGFC